MIMVREYWPYLTAAAGLTATVCIWKLLHRKKPSWPRDKVVLHQSGVGRGPWAPSLSPFPIKLETYLRMAKIPYVVDKEGGMSSKQKSPWMSYNDDDVADSQFCIDYLNNKFKVNLNNHLTDEQKAAAHAFRCLTEDNLYWCIVVFRWVYNPTYITSCLRQAMPGHISSALIKYTIPRKVRDMAWKQGMGRHSEAEVVNIAERDIKALSEYLGSKPFLTGDTPCEEDCTVFGMLAQIVWQAPDTKLETFVNEKYPNLRAYCERMKERFWSDWDQCITHGWTRDALK